MIWREGSALWNEAIQYAPSLASKHGFDETEILREFVEHKEEWIEKYGTAFTKRYRPHLFEEEG